MHHLSEKFLDTGLTPGFYCCEFLERLGIRPFFSCQTMSDVGFFGGLKKENSPYTFLFNMSYMKIFDSTACTVLARARGGGGIDLERGYGDVQP